VKSSVALPYRTIPWILFGNPVVATGVFFYPKNLKVKGVLEIPPIANMEKTDVASLNIKDKQLALESMPCMMGYITLNPDFIGGALYRRLAATLPSGRKFRFGRIPFQEGSG